MAPEQVIDKSQREAPISGGAFCCRQGPGVCWRFWLRHAARVALTDWLHWTGLDPDTSYTQEREQKNLKLHQQPLCVCCKDILLDMVKLSEISDFSRRPIHFQCTSLFSVLILPGLRFKHGDVNIPVGSATLIWAEWGPPLLQPWNMVLICLRRTIDVCSGNGSFSLGF